MKKTGITLLLTLVCLPVLFSQNSLKGISLNGSTGLFSIPTGRIGWERSSDMGLDFGYHAIINDRRAAHIPSVTLSLFKWLELSTAFDIQPNYDVWKKGSPLNYTETQQNDDLLFGYKIQFPTNAKNSANPAVAFGGNIQLINIADDDSNAAGDLIYNYAAFQFYIAASYAATFFTLPAETTLVIGKTVYYGGPKNNSDIDFGMGFDLVLFPKAIGNYIHWIIDFANFDYSDNSWPNILYYKSGPPWYRGILNTGFRFDLASIPALNKYKFILEIIFNDLFDHGNRSISVGAVFGLPIL